MRNLGKAVHLSLIALILGVTLISACTPALPRQQVEQELVPFMLRYILVHDSGSIYTESSGAQWAEAPADASLVIWAPPANPVPNDSITFLKSDQPIKA